MPDHNSWQWFDHWGTNTGEAEEGKTLSQLFEEAKRLHQLGIDGDKEAVKKAHAALESLRKRIKTNNLVEAYYGSATALLGRDAVDPMERVEKALKGLKLLDQAVTNDKEDTEIRTLRGYVCFKLPEMYFHRTKTAIEDFRYLADCYEKDSAVFAKEFYWQILYDLGLAYKNLQQRQEAETVWQKLLAQDPAVKFKKLLKQEGLAVSDLPESPVNGAEREKNLERGRELHREALAGNKLAARMAAGTFKKNVDNDPSDRLSQAYYADCLSMAGRDSSETREMFTNGVKAMKMLDEAVNYSPDDVEIRLLRARQSLRLPESFFCRTATAITDLEYLVNRYEQNSSVWPEETYWQVLFDLGGAYKRLGMGKECAETWHKLLSLSPHKKYQEQIDIHSEDHAAINPSIRTREDLYREGFRLHDLGVLGNKRAAEIALDLWRKIHQDDPSDATAEAYYGSCLALAARDSNETGNLFRNTIQALKLINQAVERDADNLRIRTLRAYLTYSLPEAFFQMTEKAIEDFKLLKRAFEQDPSSFDPVFYHKILYDLGVAYERTNQLAEAKKVWKKLLRESEDARYQELLKGRV